jgi:hypothetical protein
MITDFRNNAFLDGTLVSFFRLVRATLKWRWACSIGGMILAGETAVVGEKHYTAWVVDVWMSMELWWNDTDRRNWSTGRKILYRVGGRWMNEYGALVEWYWQEKMKYWEKNIIQRGGRWMNEYGALVEWYWQGKSEVLGEKQRRS